ncbi:MAG TPA: GNAT family N-acetyltransferase [Thermoleophilia bacterium]|nr:GNAT family N-acetyltransferase [Thermoleophilia bacterium]
MGDDVQRDAARARPEAEPAWRVIRTEVVALSDADLAEIHDLRTRTGYAEVLRGFAHAGRWMIGIALVDTAWRGCGIGKALVAAIVEDARAACVASFAAGVIVTRERSLAFWAREGFTTEVVRLERRI